MEFCGISSRLASLQHHCLIPREFSHRILGSCAHAVDASVSSNATTESTMNMKKWQHAPDTDCHCSTISFHHAARYRCVSRTERTSSTKCAPSERLDDCEGNSFASKTTICGATPTLQGSLAVHRQSVSVDLRGSPSRRAAVGGQGVAVQRQRSVLAWVGGSPVQ